MDELISMVRERINIISEIINDYNTMPQSVLIVTCKERAFGELRAYKRMLRDLEALK